MKIIRATTVPQSLNTFCRGMLRKLSEQYEVVALSSPGAELQEVAEREGVRVIAVPMERHISLRKDLASLCQLVRVFCQEKPTMVHSMTPKAGLLCMLAGWIARVPVRVHTFTGLVFPTETGMKRWILKQTDRMTCAFATFVIPEGEGVKNDLLSHHITRKPLRVLGFGNVMGVDMSMCSRRPEVMRIAEALKDADRFTFVFVGRMVRDKGINELCEAFSRLSAENAQVRLLLVGPYEDALDPISEEARRVIETNASISYVGEQHGDDLLAYYAAADCFVFPSYREGFPNTVLEAGAMGLPSIVTDINGSREIIVEGENGRIIPIRNADALYEAMRRMMAEDKARAYMASNARNMIACRFERKYVHQCLFDLYEVLLSE